MGFIGSIALFIANNIVNQPALLIGLIAAVGLIAQRKPFSDIVTGTLKTAVGFLALQQGSNIVVGALLEFQPVLKAAFGVEAAALGGAGLDQIFADYGGPISLIMAFGFLVNLLIARFTPLKYVYLTGHLMFWMATVIVSVMVEGNPSAPTWAYVLFGSIICGIYWTVQPAIIQPLMRKVTGHDQLAYGHTSASNVWLAAKLGPLVGSEEQSTEDVELPSWLGFFRDVTAATAFVISVVVIIAALFAGPAGVPSGDLNYIVYAVIQGLTFALGIAILLFGVRMVIAEIVPAFRGFAMRIVPNAKPALDCPIVFDYAPTAVLIGFLSASVAFGVIMVILGATKLAIVVPPLIMLFFPGGAGGVFGNSTGGVRGAILGGLLLGVILALGQWLVTPLLSNTAPVLTQLADPDWYIIILIFRPLLAPIMRLF
jgi:PTS system ascorbate-specific IIC component